MILTTAHTKGGVSKTTTTWHIICELKKQKKDFIVIDLDHQRTIYNLNLYVREKNKLAVFTADNISQLNKILEKHQEQLIIIDTGGNGDQINKLAIQKADMILTPIGVDSITEVIGFKKFEAILKELHNPAIKILFSNINPRCKNFEDIKGVTSSYKNATTLSTTITSRANYKQSMGQGLGITELQPTKNSSYNTRLKKSQTEIKQLIKELGV